MPIILWLCIYAYTFCYRLDRYYILLQLRILCRHSTRAMKVSQITPLFNINVHVHLHTCTLVKYIYRVEVYTISSFMYFYMAMAAQTQTTILDYKTTYIIKSNISIDIRGDRQTVMFFFDSVSFLSVFYYFKKCA